MKGSSHTEKKGIEPHTERTNLLFVGVSLGYLLQPLPIFPSEGDTTVPEDDPGDLGRDVHLGARCRSVCCVKTYLYRFRPGVIRILHELAIDNMFGRVPSQYLIDEMSLVDFNLLLLSL